MTTIGFALITNSSFPQYAVRIMLGGIICVTAVLLLAAPLHKRYHFTKKTFFGTIATIIISVTFALLATHFALISQSQNGTISKRTAQLSIVACGQEIRIAPSTFFSSGAGSGSYSLRSNGMVQYLGYEQNPSEDGTLGSFFRSAGGSISSNVVTMPSSMNDNQKLTNGAVLNQFYRTNPQGETYIEMRSGESCSVTPSMITIFVYRYDPTTKKYETLRIIQNPERYSISNASLSEHDCIIVMFDDPKKNTLATCSGYPKRELISPIAREVSL